MTKPFKIWIEDEATLNKVLAKMEKEGIKWWWSKERPSTFRADVPVALYVDNDNLLSYCGDFPYFKLHLNNEITPEEYLKEDKTMIKVGDIVRVTDWGCQYSTNSLWFLTHMDDLETEWLINYTYDDTTHYTEHQYNDTNKYRVLYVDEHEGKCLITQKSYSDRVYDIYLIGLKGVELYDKPTEMTISEIEEKLGIKNLKIVKENENG